MNWSEFFNMGGYAFYVWSSYGLMALVLILNIVLPLRDRATVHKRITRQLKQSRKTS